MKLHGLKSWSKLLLHNRRSRMNCKPLLILKSRTCITWRCRWALFVLTLKSVSRPNTGNRPGSPNLLNTIVQKALKQRPAWDWWTLNCLRSVCRGQKFARYAPNSPGFWARHSFLHYCFLYASAWQSRKDWTSEAWVHPSTFGADCRLGGKRHRWSHTKSSGEICRLCRMVSTLALSLN